MMNSTDRSQPSAPLAQQGASSPDFMSRAARSSIVPPRRALEAEPSWDEVGEKKDLLFCKKNKNGGLV